jgi:hypothetical protein
MKDLNGATELREGRREMRSGKVKKTPYGDMKFMLHIDMPGRVAEDDFKKYMVEFGEMIVEAFKK